MTIKDWDKNQFYDFNFLINTVAKIVNGDKQRLEEY